MSSVWHIECKDCKKNVDGICEMLKIKTPVNLCFSGVFKSEELKREIEDKEFEKQYQKYIKTKHKYDIIERIVIEKRNWSFMNSLWAEMDKTCDLLTERINNEYEIDDE